MEAPIIRWNSKATDPAVGTLVVVMFKNKPYIMVSGVVKMEPDGTLLVSVWSENGNVQKDWELVSRWLPFNSLYPVK